MTFRQSSLLTFLTHFTLLCCLSELPWLSSLVVDSRGEENWNFRCFGVSFFSQFSIRLLLLLILNSTQNTKHDKQLQVCQKNQENLQISANPTEILQKIVSDDQVNWKTISFQIELHYIHTQVVLIILLDAPSPPSTSSTHFYPTELCSKAFETRSIILNQTTVSHPVQYQINVIELTSTSINICTFINLELYFWI